jgi:hypothetical protein
MHGDQWPSVAEHVGTHTVLECIIRFLQLPIEDDFLDELEQRGLQHGAPSGAAAAARPASPGVAATADVHGDAVGRVPMAGRGSTQGNPVMSLVSAGWASWADPNACDLPGGCLGAACPPQQAPISPPPQRALHLSCPRSHWHL